MKRQTIWDNLSKKDVDHLVKFHTQFGKEAEYTYHELWAFPQNATPYIIDTFKGDVKLAQDALATIEILKRNIQFKIMSWHSEEDASPMSLSEVDETNEQEFIERLNQIP